MSIIVDALHKLQESKNSASENSGPSEMRLFDDEEKANQGSGNRLKLFGILALASVILFNLFLFNDDADNPVEDASELGNTIQLAKVTKKDSIDTPPIIEPTESATESSLETASQEIVTPPAEEVTPPIAVTEDSAEPLPVDSTVELQSAPTPIEPIAQEPQIEPVPQPTEEVPAQIELVEQVMPEVQPDPAPEWILQGIEQYNAGNFEKAQDSWNKGFSSLEDNTQLLSVMLNNNPDLAREMINSLIQNKLSVFTLTAMYKSKQAYYTLVLPQQGSIETSKEFIRSQMNIDPYQIDKQSMQRRVDALKRLKPKKSKPADSVDIESLITKAEKAVYQGDYDDVLKLLNPHLKQNNKNWKLLFWLGSAELGLRNYKRADNLFLKAQAINPDLPQVWTQRAIIAQELNDHTSALQFLSKAKALAPRTPEIALNIAYSYEAMGDKNGAVYSYREFLNLSKDRRGYEDLRQSAEMRLNDLIYQ